MHITLRKLSGGIFAAILSTSAHANCSDAEYSVYQRYDSFLESNPNVPDDQLRLMFARKAGMQPSALKNLYVRCATRWAEQRPDEAKAHLRKSYSDFAKDCANRPANDPYCKAGR